MARFSSPERGKETSSPVIFAQARTPSTDSATVVETLGHDGVVGPDAVDDTEDDYFFEFEAKMDAINAVDMGSEDLDEITTTETVCAEDGKESSMSPERELLHKLLVQDEGKFAKVNATRLLDISATLFELPRAFDYKTPFRLADAKKLVDPLFPESWIDPSRDPSSVEGPMDRTRHLQGRAKCLAHQVMEVIKENANRTSWDAYHKYAGYPDFDVSIFEDFPSLYALLATDYVGRVWNEREGDGLRASIKAHLGGNLMPDKGGQWVITSAEKHVMRRTIELHLDSVAVTSRGLDAFTVTHSVLDADGAPVKVFLGDYASDGYGYLRGMNLWARERSDVPVHRYRSPSNLHHSAYSASRYVSGARPIARHAAIMSSYPGWLPQFMAVDYDVSRGDFVHEKHNFSVPFGPLLYSAIYGGNSDWLPLPGKVVGRGGAHADVRTILNNLQRWAHNMRQAPPLDFGGALMRNLPSWCGGNSKSVSHESAVPFIMKPEGNPKTINVFTNLNRRLPDVRAFLGSEDRLEAAPRLRDKLQVTTILQEILYTNLDELWKVMGKPRFQLYVPSYDELGFDQQIAVLAQACVVMKNALNIAVRDARFADFARTSQAYVRLAYIDRVLDWIMRVSANPDSKEINERRNPDRRLRMLLTVICVAPINERNLIRFGVHADVARSLRLKVAAHRIIRPMELANSLSIRSFERMKVCVDDHVREFRVGPLNVFFHQGVAQQQVVVRRLNFLDDDEVRTAYFYFELRGSTTGALSRNKSLAGQLSAILWNLRDSLMDEMDESRLDAFLGSSRRFALGVAYGSKFDEERIKRLIVLPPVGGPIHTFFDEFFTSIVDDDGYLRPNAHPLDEVFLRDATRDEKTTAFGEEMGTLLHGDVISRSCYARYVSGGAKNILGALEALDEIQTPHGEPLLRANVSVHVAAYDRPAPGALCRIATREAPDSRFSFVSTWSLAARAMRSLPAVSAWNCEHYGWLGINPASLEVLETLALLGAFTTGQWNLTVVTREVSNTPWSQDVQTRASEYASIIVQMIQFGNILNRIDARRSLRELNTATLNPSPFVSRDRHAVSVLRVSNSRESFRSGVFRNDFLMDIVENRNGEPFGVVHYIFLFCVKGTEQEPIVAQQEGIDRVFVCTYARDRFVNVIRFPDEVPELGVPPDARAERNVTFVDGLMHQLVGDNPHDVFFPAMSRMCGMGIARAFANRARENPNNRRLFLWDLYVAGVQNAIEIREGRLGEQDRLGGPEGIRAENGRLGLILRADGAVNLEAGQVVAFLDLGGAADRIWRYNNNFRRPQWV